jgi:hypothetical protein
MDAYAMPKTGKEIVFDTSVSNNDMIHNKDTPSLTNTQKETIVENLKMLSGEVNQTIFLNNEKKTQEFASEGKYIISFVFLFQYFLRSSSTFYCTSYFFNFTFKKNLCKSIRIQC